MSAETKTRGEAAPAAGKQVLRPPVAAKVMRPPVTRQTPEARPAAAAPPEKVQVPADHSASPPQPPEYDAKLILKRLSEPITAKDLADQLGCSAIEALQILQDLVSKGKARRGWGFEGGQYVAV